MEKFTKVGDLDLGAFLRHHGIPVDAATAPLPPSRREAPSMAGAPTHSNYSAELPLLPGLCPDCRGTWWVFTGVVEGSPVGGWRDVTNPCRRCVNGQAEEQRLRAWAGLPAGEWTFAGYRDVTQQAGDARRAVQEWSTADDALPWLCLYGSRGTGKTHLAAAAAGVLMSLGKSVAFYAVPELLAAMGEAIGNDRRAEDGGDQDHRSEYQDIRRRLLDAEVLVLDDLGAERSTAFAMERLYEAVGHRYAGRQRLIVTSNAAPDTLDARVVSRLNDVRCCLRIRMEWADYRTEVL